MFYQIFLSPQVKRWVIITYKHVICELPHEFPNEFIPSETPRRNRINPPQYHSLAMWPKHFLELKEKTNQETWIILTRYNLASTLYRLDKNFKYMISNNTIKTEKPNINSYYDGIITYLKKQNTILELPKNSRKSCKQIKGKSHILDVDGLNKLSKEHQNNPIIGYLNINGLHNKINDLRKICRKTQIHILCIDETKIDKSLPVSHRGLPVSHF